MPPTVSAADPRHSSDDDAQGQSKPFLAHAVLLTALLRSPDEHSLATDPDSNKAAFTGGIRLCHRDTHFCVQ
jgi:hypothetical protein